MIEAAPTTTSVDTEALAQGRTRCEIYTRVMGYYRPVTQFNQGKKSEFYSRSYFDVDHSIPQRDIGNMKDIAVSVSMEENVCA